MPLQQFSQSSLQDYVDCPRRFQLYYVEGQVWPAVQAEPVIRHEQHMDLGSRFHRLVERHQLGLPADLLTATIDDDQLQGWWAAYLDYAFLHKLSGTRYPEITLSAELGGVRLAATYDLLLIVPGERAIIFDWKTYHTAPPRQWFASRLQTRVYAYVFAAAGQSLFGDSFRPEHVSMIYWLSGAPEVTFEYSVSQFDQDRVYLSTVIQEIESRPTEGAWPLTSDERRCRFCQYRSLCGRGVAAAALDDGSEFGMFDTNIALESFDLGMSDVDSVGF
ncbi:MAG TPA: PD-(D/E)XK nuclease family protein [Aggregatilineaceae bacterium]|nr:PD-(D/E)XK nuclease family protein [Aggregatilineaceae bacterium]